MEKEFLCGLMEKDTQANINKILNKASGKFSIRTAKYTKDSGPKVKNMARGN